MNVLLTRQFTTFNYHCFASRTSNAAKIDLAAIPNLPLYELSALHDFYNSTQGENWAYHGNGSPWVFTSTSNPCMEEWEGVFCILPLPRTVYHVAGLSLVEFNLRGTLPATIGNFTHITQLVLSSSALSGTIPLTIGRLTLLQTIELQTNLLVGSIPDSICKLTRLTHVDISANHLTGGIPERIGDLFAVKALDLSENSLYGTLPESVMSMSALSTLIIDRNGLFGTLPNSIQ